MPQPLPRFLAEHVRKLEDEEQLAKIVVETSDAAPESSVGATAAGDGRRLRGIPAISRGTTGAIAGTDPLRALLAKERRRR